MRASVSSRKMSHTFDVWQSWRPIQLCSNFVPMQRVPFLRSWKYSGWVSLKRSAILNLFCPWQHEMRSVSSRRRSE